MGKSLLDELKEASVSNDPAYVEFYNNGKVRREERGADQRMTLLAKEDTIRTIEYVFRRGAETYAKNCSFDAIDLGLEIGLIFNREDVGPEDIIKDGAKPLNKIVHCYTGNITSYLNGVQSNERDYYHYSIQGFLDYETLVSKMKKNGIAFDGPKTFDEFKKQVMSGENFDISLKAKLNEKVEPVEATIEEEPVDSFVEVKQPVTKEPVKCLAKIFKRRK